MKSLVDELVIINRPVDDVDLVIHTLNGLGAEFKEVSIALRICENSIIFDELHHMLTDFEAYLRRSNITSYVSTVITTSVAHMGKHYSSMPIFYPAGSS